MAYLLRSNVVFPNVAVPNFMVPNDVDSPTNLEALTEEDDEEYDDVMTEDSVSEDDEAGDGGVRQGEPNKFDGLCDGVVNAVTLVHGSLAELLELKDELLKHQLPPNVLMKIALCTTKVFRSMSDMQSPVGELLRMVRLYSTPWEEKSAALKKLHEDYNSKKEQLNSAIKRLQLIDAQSKRLEKERRVMNWEKLFSRLTTRCGHGRRWKFLIGSFKQNVKDGPESLRAYVDEVERNAVAAEGEERDIDTQMGQNAAPASASEDPASAHESESEEEAEEEQDSAGSKDVDDDLRSLDSAHKEQSKEMPIFIKPPMKDQGVWTQEPQYNRFLHIRVFKPENLDARELKCALTLGKQFYKTGILDPVPQEEEVEEEEKPVSPAKSTTSDGRPARPMRGRGRGRGSGRGRGTRPGAARGNQSAGPKEQPAEEEVKQPEGPRYEEFVFKVDSEVKTIKAGSKKGKNPEPEEPLHLKVSVHYGPKEEMIAMATIEFEDFESLELPTIFLKPPVGDTFPEVREEYVPTPAPTTPGPTVTQSPTESSTGPTPDASRDPSDQMMTQINESDPVNFPLYAIHTSVGDAVHMPAGQLPLVCFWAKKLIPTSFERATDSETVRDIVYDATGYDMDVVTKADLHKEMREKNLSAMSIHSDPPPPATAEDEEPPPEPVVPKAQYDRLLQVHKDEMESLQSEYEQKLQDLVEQFQQIQEAMMSAQGSAANSPVQQMHRTESNMNKQSASPVSLAPPSAPQRPRRARTDLNHAAPRPKKNFAVGKPLPNWGEALPKDFLERLALFEEESRRHQADITQRQRTAVQEMLEKKFQAEFKLSNPQATDFTAMEDVSLPAVFMPTTPSSKATVYNPRAAKYFHATGAGGVRLTQPPSMVQLPPIPNSRLSVINLFDVAKNFHRGGNQWLMDRYMSSQQRKQEASVGPTPDPRTPPPTYATEAITAGASPQKEAMLD